MKARGIQKKKKKTKNKKRSSRVLVSICLCVSRLIEPFPFSSPSFFFLMADCSLRYSRTAKQQTMLLSSKRIFHSSQKQQTTKQKNQSSYRPIEAEAYK